MKERLCTLHCRWRIRPGDRQSREGWYRLQGDFAWLYVQSPQQSALREVSIERGERMVAICDE